MLRSYSVSIKSSSRLCWPKTKLTYVCISFNDFKRLWWNSSALSVITLIFNFCIVPSLVMNCLSFSNRICRTEKCLKLHDFSLLITLLVITPCGINGTNKTFENARENTKQTLFYFYLDIIISLYIMGIIIHI